MPESDADTLPFSPACERNREPILALLREHLAAPSRVLEIGGGTGQHAEFFAACLPHLLWQSSDRADYLPGLAARIRYAALPRLPAPVELDVARRELWPELRFDAAYSANTLHIMGWSEVEHFFAMLGEVLEPASTLIVYGPFNYGGRFTSDSNAAFDAQLRADDPKRGIRDFEAVDALARAQGFVLSADIEMPANNRGLVWKRRREI
jgi:cyclopropane fatty-acyl-phospholipid synthase-like methyltransferase